MSNNFCTLIAILSFSVLQAQTPVTVSLKNEPPKQALDETQPTAPLQIEVLKKDVGCKGEELGYIEVEPRGGVPPYQWTWSTGASIPRIENLKPGFYQVSLTDITGHSIEKTFEIKIISPITIDFMVSPTENEYKAVEAIVNGGEAPYSYIWNTGDSESTILGEVDGTYAVRVIDDNGCHSTRIIGVKDQKPAFYEKDFSSLIKILPNPTDGIISIEYPDKFNHSSNVQLFNNFGQFMRKYPKVLPTTKSIEIDLKGLKGGLYFVRIEWAGQSILKKVMLL